MQRGRTGAVVQGVSGRTRSWKDRFSLIQVGVLISPLRRVQGIFFGWWMSGLAALILALGMVPLFHGIAVWNPVLRGRFGWTPDQLQWAFAFTRVDGGIMGPVEGILVERLGSRRMVLIGLLVLGGGFLLFSRIDELWHLYGVFFLMSLGAALGTWLPMMTVMNHWFVKHRSKAMGLAWEGNAVGAIMVIPLIAWAIGGVDADQPDRFGWRATAAGIGVVIMLLAFPISRLVRNRPEDYGLSPDGDASALLSEAAGQTETPRSTAGELGFTWQEAIRTRAFWLISFGHAGSATVVVTVMVHLGLILDDRGLSLQMVGWVVATYTAVSAIFILVGGHIGDRVSIRHTIFCFSSFMSAAVIILLVANSPLMAFLFAVVMGIGWGGRVSMVSSIRGVYFGRRAFARITGVSMVPLNVILFATPIFVGYMYRFTSSYTVAFIVIAVISFLGSALYLFLGEPKPLPDSSVAVERTAT